MFDHLARISETASKLFTLQQGASTMADCSIHFQIVVANSGWNDTALRGVYIQRLAEELKDELAAQEEMPDLEMLLDLSIGMDNHLRERRRDRVRLRYAVSPMVSG